MAEIRLERLTKRFDDVVAVDSLSIQVPHGAFVALLGPSGCGKTTTMNMISGIERPTSGEILFDGEPITDLEPGQRSVGFVFQNYAIFSHMTVYDNLAFGLRVRKDRLSKDELDAQVKRVAETVRLVADLERKASRLSVNDLQKVALGRSMIVEPAIFLLDEPFSNLDAAFRAYMRAELKRIQHDIGQTMVYVTHDQVEAMSMADQIAVMNLGELQQYGSPDEIYNRPANRFVANFVGSVLINLLPCRYENGERGSRVVPEGPHARGVDVSDRRAAIEPAAAKSTGLTLAVRPERIRLVPPDSAEATIQATVSLVEPLGAKDIVHLSFDKQDVRAVSTPGSRPRIGDHVGLEFEAPAVHVIDDETGLVLR